MLYLFTTWEGQGWARYGPWARCGLPTDWIQTMMLHMWPNPTCFHRGSLHCAPARACWPGSWQVHAASCGTVPGAALLSLLPAGAALWSFPSVCSPRAGWGAALGTVLLEAAHMGGWAGGKLQSDGSLTGGEGRRAAHGRLQLHQEQPHQKQYAGWSQGWAGRHRWEHGMGCLRWGSAPHRALCRQPQTACCTLTLIPPPLTYSWLLGHSAKAAPLPTHVYMPTPRNTHTPYPPLPTRQGMQGADCRALTPSYRHPTTWPDDPDLAPTHLTPERCSLLAHSPIGSFGELCSGEGLTRSMAAHQNSIIAHPWVKVY